MDSTFKIKYTEYASEDLDQILSYLDRYRNLSVLMNFKAKTDFSFKQISVFPSSCEIIFQQHGFHYRKLNVGSYIFIYYIDYEQRSIIIFRVFHESEDYQNIFKSGK